MTTQQKRVDPSLENSRIASEALQADLEAKRRARFPSADDILNSLGNTKVIFK